MLIGIDGADWDVIRDLWARGELPNLRRLADAGTSATLRTDYGISPVIWTSVVTGQPSKVHGIVDFVVPTAQGDVPVSSTVRRVPALWTMASAAGRRVAAISWWASWPAEPVRGVMVSDRALLGLADGVSPASFRGRFGAIRQAALGRPNRFGSDTAVAERDQVTAELGRTLAAEGFDLTLIYFRAVDVASHRYWRYLHPEGFGPPPPGEGAEHGDEIQRVYAATDEAIGRIVAAADNANVFVASDHGFRRLPREEVMFALDFDRVLERLGYLKRAGGAVDWRRTRLFVSGSPATSRLRRLRYALAGREADGTVLPAERAAIRAALERDLARFTWSGGQPAFRVRAPRPREAREGADLVVAMLTEGVSALRLDGKALPGMVTNVSRISGTHDANTHGIFIAAGPDLARAALARGMSIFDVAPTVLYALGLPVAEDFPGEARTGLFSEVFERRHPLRTIRTWGKPRIGGVTASSADAALVRELEALGYLR